MASDEVDLEDDDVEVDIEGENPESPDYAGEDDEVCAEGELGDTERPEVEGDDPDRPASARVKHTLSLNSYDATPDVFFSGGGIVSALSQGPFLHLLSGVRANTGARGGRYLFEVEVLEKVPIAQHDLRIGFSTGGSSLFIGDSSDSVGFGKDGTYFVAEPGQLTDLQRSGACEPLLETPSVIGVLLNLDQESKAANTISVFLDGFRAGPPQPVPSHLRGKALYPTINFRGLTLAVNFGHGGKQLRTLPFKCQTFAQMAEAHHEIARHDAVRDGMAKLEVVVSIGIPEAGIADFTRCFKEQHTDFAEISDRSFAEWCQKSGKPKLATQDKAAQKSLVTLAVAGHRNCLIAGVGQTLQRSEREQLLNQFPSTYRKVALVAVGEPSQSHKQWVRKTLEAEYEAKKDIFQRRQLLSDASGVELDDADNVPPDCPKFDDTVWALPHDNASAPDVSPDVLSSIFSRFALPTDAEGFDDIRYEWSPRSDAQDKLRRWIVIQKSAFLVEGLEPGEWFRSKLAAWKEERKLLREGHLAFNNKKGKGPSIEADADISGDLAGVGNIHDFDGRGTPLYANFRYEDWVLLSWRYELHLLVHGFATDAADDDIPGIHMDHVMHYFKTYFGVACEPKDKLGVASIGDAVKLLREPLEFIEKGDGQQILHSSLEKETPFEVFVKGIEAYRRDRSRRLEAGDESAQLSFPRPTGKTPGKGVPFKAAPAGKGVTSKGSPSSNSVPVKALPVPAKALPGKAAPAKAGLAKAAIAKAAPVGAMRRAIGATAAATGSSVPHVPAKAAPRGVAATADLAQNAGLKRALVSNSHEVGLGASPPVKRPRAPDGSPLPAKAKSVIAKMRPTMATS